MLLDLTAVKFAQNLVELVKILLLLSVALVHRLPRAGLVEKCLEFRLQPGYLLLVFWVAEQVCTAQSSG